MVAVCGAPASDGDDDTYDREAPHAVSGQCNGRGFSRLKTPLGCSPIDERGNRWVAGELYAYWLNCSIRSFVEFALGGEGRKGAHGCQNTGKALLGMRGWACIYLNVLGHDHTRLFILRRSRCYIDRVPVPTVVDRVFFVFIYGECLFFCCCCSERIYFCPFA